jgi:GH24 family phage-related lysozyme (muramidase)
MDDNDSFGDNGNYGSGSDTELGDGNSYGESSATSAGGGTSYGENSEKGVTGNPTGTPSDTPDGGDSAPQTESTGYSYSVTPDGQFVLHSPSGSELHGRTPDGRHIMRQSDGSLLELHFGDEHGRMRSTPYYEEKPAPYARTATPDISTASLLDDFRFYNRDISAGYMAYSAARESLRIENEMRAYGFMPSPKDQTPPPAPSPAASAPISTPAPESSSASANGLQDPAQANQSGTSAQPQANEDSIGLGASGQLATREGNKALLGKLTKPALPQANGAASEPDDSFRAALESIYPQRQAPAPGGENPPADGDEAKRGAPPSFQSELKKLVMGSEAQAATGETPTQISQEATKRAKDLIKTEEGFKDKPYLVNSKKPPGPDNKWTVGYGHELTKDELEEWKKAGETYTWDLARAEAVFKKDFDKACEGVRTTYPWAAKLDDSRLAVLISMRYQLGSGDVKTGEKGLAGFKKALLSMQLVTTETGPITNDMRNSAADEMLKSDWFKEPTQSPNRALRASAIMRTGIWPSTLKSGWDVPPDELKRATGVLGLTYKNK